MPILYEIVISRRICRQVAFFLNGSAELANFLLCYFLYFWRKNLSANKPNLESTLNRHEQGSLLRGWLHGRFQPWAEILMTYQGWNFIPWYLRNQLFFIIVLHDKIFNPRLSLPQGFNFQPGFWRRKWNFSPGLKLICVCAWVLFHKKTWLRKLANTLLLTLLTVN